MPVTRQDIEKYITTFFEYLNKPEVRALKDEEGQPRKTADGGYITSEFGPEKQYQTTWSPVTTKEIYVNIYCHDSKGDCIEDLTYEEWYIEAITDSAILLQSTGNLAEDTLFEMIPLDKITRIQLGV